MLHVDHLADLKFTRDLAEQSNTSYAAVCYLMTAMLNDQHLTHA